MLQLPFISFIVFVLGFGLLILVHELGHFLVARWVGIKCTQFAIGFGPSMLTWRRGIGFRVGSTEKEYEQRLADGVDAKSLGETEYRLNYLPLGGYVKMLGQEDLDPSARSSDPRSFNSKSVGARFAVISAGVIMNMIFGLLFFIIAFMWGVKFPPAMVGGVMAEMPAAMTYAVGHEGEAGYRGLQVGDRIVAIDGKPAVDFLDVKISTALAAADAPIDLLVERPGEKAALHFRMTPQADATEGLLSLGMRPPVDTVVAATMRSGRAKEAGVEPGMRVVAVGGEEVRTFGEYLRATTAARNKPVEVTFADEATGAQVRATLGAQPLLQQERGDPPNLLGLVPAAEIMGFTEKSAAEAAGMREGDLIASIGEEAWPAVSGIPEIVKAAQGEAVAVRVWRDGEIVDLGPIAPRSRLFGPALIGIVPSWALDQPIVGQTLANHPASSVNLPPGSRVTAVNGQSVSSWSDIQQVLVEAAGQGQGELGITLTVQLNLAGEPTEQVEVMVSEEEREQLAGLSWMEPGDVFFAMLQTPVKAANPWEATQLGFAKTNQFMMQAYLMLVRLIQGSVPPEAVSGPVGILDAGTRFTKEGWSYLLFFLGLLSVNLAVINFLPIPIADGGQAVFLLIEKIKGSPVSAGIQQAAMWVGLALIGFVFLFVTYHDVARKIQELTQ